MPEGAPAQARQDKLLTCVDCGAQFVFSVRDQAFYQERGYQAPRRCKACRDKRKTSAHPTLGAQGGNSAAPPGAQPAGAPARSSQPSWAAPPSSEEREQFKVTCSGCGAETTVPFKPDPNRPVYCRTCYLNRRKTGGKPALGKPAQAPSDLAEKGETSPGAEAPAAPAPEPPAPPSAPGN